MSDLDKATRCYVATTDILQAVREYVANERAKNAIKRGAVYVTECQQIILNACVCVCGGGGGGGGGGAKR